MKTSIFSVKIVCLIMVFIGVNIFDKICYAKKSKSDTLIYEYKNVEIPPTYIKGVDYINEYVNKNIVKPDTILSDSPFAEVYIEFVVEKDGKLGYVRAIEGYGDEFSAEVVKVFKTLSGWKPGKIKSKPKRVKCVMEVVIKTGKGFNDEVFAVAEKMPQFPGGSTALQKFLIGNIRYPVEARTNKIQGRVYVTFVVEKDGSITNIRVLKGIGGGCDEEAVRIVKLMPPWIPGTQRGIPVRVQYNCPIRFVLQLK